MSPEIQHVLQIVFVILTGLVGIMGVFVILLRRSQQPANPMATMGPTPTVKSAKPAQRQQGSQRQQASPPQVLSAADQETQLRALIGTGRKLEAIKLYREMTGLGLKEAKEAVETFSAGDWSAFGAQPVAHQAMSADGEAQLQQLIAAGRKIEAIKAYRAMTGLGLQEAKEAIEALAAKAAIPSAQSPATQAKPSVKPAPGMAKVEALVRENNLIEAIKVYRSLRPCTLKEAKEAVETMHQQLQ